MAAQVVNVQGVSNARPLWERWQGKVFWLLAALVIILFVYLWSTDQNRSRILLFGGVIVLGYFAFDFLKSISLPKKKWDVINKIIIPNSVHLFGIKVSRKDFRGMHDLNDRKTLYMFAPPRDGFWTFEYDFITGTGGGVYHYGIDGIVAGANESEVTKMVLSDQQRRLKLQQELENRGLYDPGLSEESQ